MSEGARIRVVIADDHFVVRRGLKAILEDAGDIVVVAEARNGHELVAAFDAVAPDVAIADARMPELDGVAAIAAILARHPHARVIALSSYEGSEDIRRALDAGAWTYLLKRTAEDELPDMVRAVARGEKRLAPEIRRTLGHPHTTPKLSAREREVLQALAQGLSNRLIGERLGIALTTVNSHVATILLKLGAATRTEAVTAALHSGLLRLDD